MRLFKGVKDTYKKSEAAVIAQNLLAIFVQNHMFSGSPSEVANQLVTAVWSEIPQLLDGSQGSRPHKLTIAASAFAHAIRIHDAELPTSRSHIYALCIGKILTEIEERGEKYPLSKLDHSLLESAAEIFLEFSEAQSETPLAKDITQLLDRNSLSWEEWYQIYKKSAAAANPALSINEKGFSILDVLEHEPLLRAYQDGVEPQELGRKFGVQFDITKIGL